MKKAIAFLLIGVIAVTVLVVFQACHRDHYKTVTYKVYHALTIQKSAVLGGINGNAAEPIGKAGQIYLKGSLVFLNDLNKGIHVYDNSDPAHPSQIAFLNIPGNQNIAMRGNILYADVYCGLLAIDLTNVQQAKVVGVNWNIFQYRGSTTDTSAVINAYDVKDTTVTVPVVQPTPPGGPVMLEAFAAANSSTIPGTGIGGSEAAMALIGNYMYTIPQAHGIGVIDISDPTQLKVDTVMYGAYDLETVF